MSPTALREAKLRESEATFRGFFENNGVGMAQADIATGKLPMVNAKLCKLLGYSADELEDMTLLDVIHPDDRTANWARYSTACEDKPHYRMEKRLIRKDGSVIWVRINAGMIHDASGNPVRTAAVIEDISDRKLAEATLQASKAAAEEANRIKDDFLATLSHELRMPLAKSCLGQAHAKRSDHRRQSDPRRTECHPHQRRGAEGIDRGSPGHVAHHHREPSAAGP